MIKQPVVYMLASKRNGTLYVGVTSNLPKRIEQHQTTNLNTFTTRYKVKRLVYVEPHTSIIEAITREKQIKKWNRNLKLRLIEEMNPEWNDLSSQIS